MRKVILFILLFFCLCITPVSAFTDWELTFEDTASDAGSYDNLVVATGTSVGCGLPSTESFNNNWDDWASHALLGHTTNGPGTTAYFDINLLVDDYLSYTFMGFAYNYGTKDPVCQFYGYNSTGSEIVSFSTFVSMYEKHRIELIRSYDGTYSFYVDGIFLSKTSVINDSIDHFRVGGCQDSRYECIIDDFTTTPYWILGGHDVISGSPYYISYGLAPSIARTQIVRLFAPDGGLVASSNLSTTAAGVLSYNSSLFSAPGDYTFRMYCVYGNGDINYLHSKTVTAGESSESNCIIELDQESYSAGDEMSIYIFTSPYEAGYQLKIYSKTALEETISITSQDQNSYYTIPADALSGTWLVKLIAPDGSTELMKSFSVIGNLYPDTAIRFEKDAYTIDDNVRIFYDDLPPDTTVLLTGSRSGPVKIFENQWDDRKGAGTLTYQLAGQDIEYLEVIASCGGQVVASDLVLVSQGSDYILSGAVYDASTNVPLPGCEIGSSTFKYTDEAGRYSLTLPAGLNHIQLSAPGYHPQEDNITLSSPTTTKNWYLVPITNATGGTIYGATANYADGSPVGSVYVRIFNTSGASYSMLTRSGTGYFSFDMLPEGSTWTLSASKNGYDNHQSTVTVSGDTLHLVRMVPEDYDPNAPTTTPGTPGSTPGSSTTDDRPSRAAARESLDWLEGTIPSLIQLVVLVFFMALIGVKL